MVRDVNRTAGDIVAVVIAETDSIAQDAMELIDARYDSMPAVTDVYAAIEDGAPQLYDEYSRNIAFNWVEGEHVSPTPPSPVPKPPGWSCSISMWSTTG